MLADDLWVLRRRRSSQSRREVLRPRRAKTAISSAGRVILQTALAIVDSDGVDGLSMRRFSNAVGRDPVRLYRHVPNNAAVLDGVAKIVLAQLSVDNTDPNWAGQLRTVAYHFRQLALAHPNVVPLLDTRPLATPLGQRPPEC
jgi:AcrR family transcriptional regulator